MKVEVRKVNRKALTNAVKEVLSQQRLDARNEVPARITGEMELDERVLVLRSLQELHPSMKDIFGSSINELVKAAQYEVVKDMPNGWIDSAEQIKIRGKLELMTDEELRAYTLEELASLVKDK